LCFNLQRAIGRNGSSITLEINREGEYFGSKKEQKKKKKEMMMKKKEKKKKWRNLT